MNIDLHLPEHRWGEVLSRTGEIRALVCNSCGERRPPGHAFVRTGELTDRIRAELEARNFEVTESDMAPAGQVFVFNGRVAGDNPFCIPGHEGDIDR